MSTRQASYEDIEASVLPGDVIAFAGNDPVSALIKAVTRSPVSHVGVVLSAPPVVLIEANAIRVWQNGTVQVGVHTSLLAQCIAEYRGSLWWLPVHSDIRERMDEAALVAFLQGSEGKQFDYGQMIITGLRIPTPFLAQFYYCSELTAAALVTGHVMPPLTNCEVTPGEICRWPVFGDVVQVKGDFLDLKIAGPEGSGVEGLGYGY